MEDLDLATLPGDYILHKLLNYIKLHGDVKKGFRIVSPEVLPDPSQRGETCKLAALSHAIEQAAQKSKSPYVKLYKDKTHPISLRRLAKEHGSIVGEMYSLGSLFKTCVSAGYKPESYGPANEDEYIEKLIQLVNERLAPVVFFDVTLGGERSGFPRIGDGTNEHAAVVMAYYKTAWDETRFIVTHWGRVYDFDGMELALSSFSLVKRREVETFLKVTTMDGKSAWFLKNKAHMYGTVQTDIPERTATAMTDTDMPLRGKILVVTERIPSTSSFFSVGGALAAAIPEPPILTIATLTAS
jgi:hypothetical protein